MNIEGSRTKGRNGPVSRHRTSEGTKDKGKGEKKIQGPIDKLRPRVPPGNCDGKTAPNAHKLAELGL